MASRTISTVNQFLPGRRPLHRREGLRFQMHWGQRTRAVLVARPAASCYPPACVRRARAAGQDIHEVALKIDITAKAEEGTAFRIELLYAGLFALRNLPEEQLQPFLLAEAPRLLFPFARKIIADASTEGGFPPLRLDPIDFAGLYMQSAAQPQAAATGGQAGDVTGQA